MDLRRARDLAVDVVPALLLLGLGQADVWARLSTPFGTGSPRTAVVPVLVATAALAFRRRFPLVTLSVVVAAIAVPGMVAPVRVVYWGELVPWIVATYAVARHCGRRRALGGLGLTLAAYAVLAPQYPELREPGNVLYDVLLLVIGWGIGLGVRRATELRRRSAAFAAERRAAEERAAREERARIARELHDVIAHGVGVMVVQAGGARTVLDRSPEDARDALARIERIGRESLAELRLLLTVLRDDGGDADIAPQPTLQHLDLLCDQMRDAGLPVTLVGHDTAGELSPALQMSAYRVVQEGLTNVLKHAGRVSTTVTVACGGSLTVEVCNDGPPAAPPQPVAHSGFGLVGLAERVSVLGGTLSAGPHPAGGFRLHADIPLHGAVT